MSSQIMTLAMLEAEYKAKPDTFRELALRQMLPSAVEGCAKACRGEKPFLKPQRWAILAAMRVAGWLGQTPQLSIAVMIANQIGARDSAEAERIMALATRAVSASDDDAFRLAKQVVRARVMADPDERRRVLQEVFGTMEVPAAVTNGHASNGPGTP